MRSHREACCSLRWGIWLCCVIQMSCQALKKERKKVGNYATPLQPKPHWLFSLHQGPPSFQFASIYHEEPGWIEETPPSPAVCVSLCNRCYVRPALQTHSRVQYFCFSSHFFNPPTTAWHYNYITALLACRLELAARWIVANQNNDLASDQARSATQNFIVMSIINAMFWRKMKWFEGMPCCLVFLVENVTQFCWICCKYTKS